VADLVPPLGDARGQRGQREVGFLQLCLTAALSSFTSSAVKLYCQSLRVRMSAPSQAAADTIGAAGMPSCGRAK
jgi:hypothetical protein